MPRRIQNSIPYAVSFDGLASSAVTPSLSMGSTQQFTLIFDLLLLERLPLSIPIELSTNYNSNNAFALFLTNQSLSFSVHGNTSNRYSTANTNDGEIPLGRRVRVACTWNGTQVSGQTLIYINGQGRTSGYSSDQQVTDAIGNAALYFGGRAGAGSFSKYQISECILIVGKRLNDEEIMREYKTREIDLTGATKVLHLMADSGNATWRDDSGNGNNATISNAVQTRGRDSRRNRFPVKPTLEDILAIPGISVYDADTGITKDGSDKVSQWNDLTRNGYNFVQATGANQPTWQASSINNLPAVRFAQAATSFMLATNGFGGGNLPNSLFCVAKPHTSVPAAFCGFMAMGMGVGGGNTSSIGTNNLQKLWFGGAGDGTLDFFVPTVGETYFLGKIHNGRCVDVFVNGRFISTQGALVNSNISPATSMALGLYSTGTTPPNVDIAFAVFAYRALDMAEMQAIYRYAKNKFSTPIARTTASGRQTADVYGAAGVQATGTITVNDYSGLAGNPATGSFTVTDYNQLVGASLALFGFATLVEGADFSAATSNNATALSIANAINTAVGEDVTDVSGGTVTLIVPGDMNGQSATWTVPLGGGVTPTVVTMTGGVAVTDLHLASGFQPFGTDPGYIDPGNSNDECADNIAAWINGGGGLTAVAVGNVVTVTANDPGTIGNTYDMSQQPHDGIGTISNGLSFSGAFLSGGVDASTSRHRSLVT